MGDDVEVLVHRACQTSSKAYGRSVFWKNCSTRRAKLRLLSSVAQLLVFPRDTSDSVVVPLVLDKRRVYRCIVHKTDALIRQVDRLSASSVSRPTITTDNKTANSSPTAAPFAHEPLDFDQMFIVFPRLSFCTCMHSSHLDSYIDSSHPRTRCHSGAAKQRTQPSSRDTKIRAL